MIVLSQTMSPDPLIDSLNNSHGSSHIVVPHSIEAGHDYVPSPIVYFHGLDPRVEFWIHGLGFRYVYPMFVLTEDARLPEDRVKHSNLFPSLLCSPSDFDFRHSLPDK